MTLLFVLLAAAFIGGLCVIRCQYRNTPDDLTAAHAYAAQREACAGGHHRLVPVCQPLTAARVQWRWRCAHCPAVWADYPDELVR